MPEPKKIAHVLVLMPLEIPPERAFNLTLHPAYAILHHASFSMRRWCTMLHIEDILPLTDFKRNTVGAIQQIHQSGRPLVLTVNGRAELVVQSAPEWQAMQDRLAQAEAVAGIRRGLDAIAAGETVELDAAVAELRGRNGLSR